MGDGHERPLSTKAWRRGFCLAKSIITFCRRLPEMAKRMMRRSSRLKFSPSSADEIMPIHA
jgi:hypothetical protein